MQILACHVSSDASSSGKKENVFATVVYGNLYKIEKKRVALGQTGKLMKTATIIDTPITSDN